MNKVILIGNLTKDAEIRTTSTGKKVASLSIATSEGKDSQGNTLTEYHQLQAWDKLAEIIEKYTTKGKKIAVVGSLKTESWEKDGAKHYKTYVVIRELELLSPRTEETRQTNNVDPMNEPTQLPEIDINNLPY